MVNINTVYQTVLALANKEQRGYITPQEFNLFANQAQMSIFEQYFYDLNQFLRVPGNNTAYADMVNLLEEKIKLGAEMFRHWVLHDISSLVFSCLCFQLQTIQLQVVEKSGVENSRVEVFG